MARGLNRFTGVAKTPDELAFLIRERQWRDGELRQLYRRLSRLHKTGRVQEMPETAERIMTVSRELEALDSLIGMHPIKVDLSKIPRVNENKKELLPYGGLSVSSPVK